MKERLWRLFFVLRALWSSSWKSIFSYSAKKRHRFRRLHLSSKDQLKSNPSINSVCNDVSPQSLHVIIVARALSALSIFKSLGCQLLHSCWVFFSQLGQCLSESLTAGLRSIIFSIFIFPLYL